MLLIPTYSIFAHQVLVAMSTDAASIPRPNVHWLTASMSSAKAEAPGAARRRQATTATDAAIADVANETTTRAERCQAIRCQGSYSKISAPRRRGAARSRSGLA